MTTTYTLPREAYELLVEALGEKSKAETLARALERSIQAIEERADEAIVEKKGLIKIELKDELRQELVTRELFEERMKVIDEKFKSLERGVNERFNVVDERFKSLERGVNERFNVVDEKFKSLEAEQREQRREMGEFRQEVNQRFDRMNELIVGQTRWMVGTIVGFGTLMTVLLAISQFTP